MAVITLRKELARNGMRPGVMIIAVFLGLAVLVATASAMVQSQDPLDLYDANDDGLIDADEAITAVSDHLAGRIDRALAFIKGVAAVSRFSRVGHRPECATGLSGLRCQSRRDNQQIRGS